MVAQTDGQKPRMVLLRVYMPRTKSLLTRVGNFGMHGSVVPARVFWHVGIVTLLHGSVFARGAAGVDCDQYRVCSLGALRQDIIDHNGIDQSDSIVKALLRYKVHPDCPDPAIESKRITNHPDYTPTYHGPQCYSKYCLCAALVQKVIGVAAYV